MRENMRRSVTLLVIAIILLGYVVSLPAGKSLDQGHSRVDLFENPRDVSFNSVAWDGSTYTYAIAVGYDSGSSEGVIYRYDPGIGWTKIYSSASETYNDVTYHTGDNSGTFYVVGSDGTDSLVLRVENASGTPFVSRIGPSPGAEMMGVTVDPRHGNGVLVCCGYDLDRDNNREGLIIVHSFGDPDTYWTPVGTGKDEVLEDITFNGGGDYPLFIAVGTNMSSGHGVAYAYNYTGLRSIQVPDECSSLHSVSWYSPNPDGYALMVGENGTGGVVYRLDVNFPGARISYANANNPRSLKFIYGGNEGHASIPSIYAFATFTDVAVDSHGFPYIVYYDSYRKDLVVAHDDGGGWKKTTIDERGDVGQYCSIVVNSSDVPHVLYYDATNGYLKHAWYEGRWISEIVDGSGSAGTFIDTAIWHDRIYVSYIDGSRGLMVADLDGYWNTENIDTYANGDTAISVDSNGNPSVAYMVSGKLDYRKWTGSSWSSDGFSQVDVGGTEIHVVMDTNNSEEDHILVFNSSSTFLHAYRDGSWTHEDVHVSYSPGHYAYDGDFFIDRDDSIVLVFSYVNSSHSSLPYSMNYTSMNADGTWNEINCFDCPDTGISPSMVMYSGFYFSTTKIYPSDPTIRPLALFGVAWSPDGSQATIVGESGSVYIYYGGKYMTRWNEKGADMYAVAVKPPGSPAYSLTVGSSSSGIISYQVADTSTTISARNIIPHINSLDMQDQYGNSVLNRQVDVGSTYVFRMNTSYEGGWGKIGLNISAWYDMYDGVSEKEYNDTLGKNLNFLVHFEPDPVDPYNRTGNCTLLWPNTEEVELDHWEIYVEDNPSAGSRGINDGHDFYHISIFLRFGPQMAYASGDGTWDASPDREDRSLSFNDPYSWNLNVTIYDRTAPVARESKYDEFGIYAYTEVRAEGSPGGSGVPGSMINLSPSSRIYVRTNVPYNLTVNVSDLINSDGTDMIPRTYVEVMNSDPAGYNTSSNTDIYQWTAFPASGGALFVWGTSSGMHMPPLGDGTYTAGYRAGYSTSPEYTTVMWRMYIPVGLKEDTFSASITFSIDYEI